MAACAACGRDNPADARFCLACGAALENELAGREVRKTVTILRSDVTGSTSLGEQLDPESLRRVMGRLFEEMRNVVERHGGTVEKFIGDAVMAVFGVPQAHEDDALRAVRAAAEMRERLSALNEELERDRGVRLALRTGITTGEVVAGDPAIGQAFVTGDPANVAARLEQAAEPGEILVGEPTYRLVSAAVEAEPVEPFTVKGKAERVTAYRLLLVLPGAEPIPRRLDTPMVGREREIAELLELFAEAKRERSCRLVTVLGEPGIGKTRLVNELTRQVGSGASVLQGRCLPYGEGITYWPLVELVRKAASGESRASIAKLVEGEPDAELIADRVAAAVGLGGTVGASEEIAWAVRRLFERLAGERPLVVLLDDLQWAEPTFLDLVEHIAYLSRSAPIMLLCLARSEFVATRPDWSGTRLPLDPLSDDESGRLINEIAGQLDEAVSTRVATAAEGNPLFLEQLLALGSSEGGALTVPPSIQALLAARLDRLGPHERRTLECASVVGQEFWSGAVRELATGSTGAPLLQLVREDLIEPHESIFPDEDGFRFVHILVRDAAYESMPKEARAGLHERFATWIEQKDAARVGQHEEIVGYHLEQAYRYRAELGPADAADRCLAHKAAERLASAGRRAADRGDMAAANLLGRALDLLPMEDPVRLDLLLDLGAALAEAGDLLRAEATFGEGAETAAESGNRRLELHALLGQKDALLLTDPEGRVDELKSVAESAISLFKDLGDELGLARAWYALGEVGQMTCHYAESAQALERGLVHAERAGARREERAILKRLAVTITLGPTPVAAGIERFEALLARSDRIAEAQVVGRLALLEAMRGRFDEARKLCERSVALCDELGLKLGLAQNKAFWGEVELFAGDAAAAEGKLRESCELFEELGERAWLSTRIGELAESLYDQGRYEEAERCTHTGEGLTSSDDVDALARCRGVRAKVIAQRGVVEQALSLATEAVGLLDDTDQLVLQGEAWLNLAEVLQLAGRREETASAVRRAKEKFEQKGMTVGVEKTNGLLAQLASEPLAERD